MDVNTEFYTYWAVVLVAFFISVASFRKLDLSLKFFVLLLGYDLLSEMAAHFAALRYHNNMPVYHVSVPVTALLTSLYYNYAIPVFRQYRVGWLIAGASIAASLLNTALLQPLNTFNNNAMLFIGSATIGMALFTFCRTFLHGDLGKPLWHDIHFLLSLALLFYWSGTLSTWFFLSAVDEKYVPGIFMLIWLVNILTYTGIGAIFFINNKKIST